jgi:hypothetical protein
MQGIVDTTMQRADFGHSAVVLKGAALAAAQESNKNQQRLQPPRPSENHSGANAL